jgi:hypothetical protein
MGNCPAPGADVIGAGSTGRLAVCMHFCNWSDFLEGELPVEGARRRARASRSNEMAELLALLWTGVAPVMHGRCWLLRRLLRAVRSEETALVGAIGTACQKAI